MKGGATASVLRTASRSPKYDNENLGCGFNGQLVGFAHRVLRKGRNSSAHLDSSINNGIIAAWQRLKTSSQTCGATPKGFVFKTFAKYAIPILVRLDKQAVVIESIKRRGRATRESIFRMTKERQKHIR